MPSNFSPNTIDDAATLLDTADLTPPLRIRGGQTKSSVLAQPGGSELSTCHFNRVIDFSPADLTITVESGITLRALDALLATHKLRLPLDPPDHDGRATLGGVLAANDFGPLRLAHGTAREHVIGMSMVLADGTLIKSGGKVVKNVAGYDLHRLFVGSYGSLGLIATVSLKLKPRAESLRLVTLDATSITQADDWTFALLRGPTRPAILDWRSQPGPDAAHRPVQVVVGFEDNCDSVDEQILRIQSDFPASLALSPEESAALYDRLRTRPRAGFQFCARVPSGCVAECFAVADFAALHAHAANGIVHGHLLESGNSRLDLLREFVLSSRGVLTVTPPEHLAVWFRAMDPPARELECRLKSRLDPAGVFPPPPFADKESSPQ